MKNFALASMMMLSATVMTKAEEYYFRGFTEVFSLGICSVGPGECYSYLNVDSAISDACSYSNKNEPVKVAGHSMGTGAAMRFTWEVSKCGRNVTRVVFLDALTHPYNMPKHTKWKAFHTLAFSDAVEGKDKDKFEYDDNTHIFQTFGSTIKNKVRSFLDN